MNKIWNWIKNIFKPKKQDPHLEMYEEPAKPTTLRLKHQGHNK